MVAQAQSKTKKVALDTAKCAQLVQETGISKVVAYGSDCKAYGANVDMLKLLKELFPEYETWASKDRNTVFKNSWSMVWLFRSLSLETCGCTNEYVHCLRRHWTCFATSYLV